MFLFSILLLILFYREFICHVAVIFLAWLKIRLWPVFLVWRIGIFLALQTNAHMLRILDAMFAADASALEVASVALYARLICEHLHENTSFR